MRSIQAPRRASSAARLSSACAAAVLALASAGPATPAAAAAATNTSPAGEAWWAHVKELASNTYGGRLTGSPGYLKAAEYVKRQFQAAGLQPAGENGGWFQTVRFDTQTVDQGASRVALKIGDRTRPLAVGPEMLLGSRAIQPTRVSAPLVFVGYGIHLPEAGYDDFKGLDLKGKILVRMAGGPSNLSAALKAHAGAYALPRILKASGAVGMITIPNPASMDIPWARLRLLSSQTGMQLADPALKDYPQDFFTATVNPEVAPDLFAASGHAFSELAADVAGHRPLPTFPLRAELSAEVVRKVGSVTSPNIVGVLRGSDPSLAAQYVVLSAHLDHLGVGAPIKGDPVYHGAMDNAAGVASLIETARTLAHGPRPRRSIIFLAVCGEEKGLLGSLAYAEHPTVPKSDIVADINVDEFLPLYPLHHLLIQGEGESTLGAEARTVAHAMGYDTLPDPAPDRVIFVRSDQYSFIKTGVPSIALGFIGAPGSPEEKMEKDWNTNRYHSPQDDLTQPVDIKAAGDFDAYFARLARTVADAPTRPAWESRSFFRRFASTLSR